MCPVSLGPNNPILRDKNSKHYASLEQVPKVGNESTEFYPTYCSGWLWITSPGTSQAISKAAQVVRFFWIDDVWVSGYIAEHLKIEHQVKEIHIFVFCTKKFKFLNFIWHFFIILVQVSFRSLLGLPQVSLRFLSLSLLGLSLRSLS